MVVRRLLTTALLVVLVVYGAGALLFLLRDDDPLREADAVVVLAGGSSRLPEALALVRAGAASVLFVSADPSGKDGARDSVCAGGRVDGAQLVCREAHPFSTRGEARLVAQLAEERGWDRIAIVTSRYHLFRAERLFARCTDAELVMRGVEESMVRNIVAVPLEWLKLGLAETFRRGC